MSAAVFSEEKWDALRELLNLGMGTAGAALAAAFGTFVHLKVPRTELVDPARVLALLGGEGGVWSRRELVCIRQAFFGGIQGEALMFLDGVEPAELADLFGQGGELGPAEQEELLLDLANAVIGACVNATAEGLAEVVSFSPPSLLGSPADTRVDYSENPDRVPGPSRDEASASKARLRLDAIVTREVAMWREILLIDVDFELENRRCTTRVLVFLAETSVARIDQALSRFLADLAASSG